MTRSSARRTNPTRLLLAASAMLFALVVVLSGPNPPQARAWPSAEAVSLRANAPRPAIKQHPIPFGKKRKHEMASYSERHYGKREWRLTKPRVIVEHYAVASTLGQIFSIFKTDQPDVEFGGSRIRAPTSRSTAKAVSSSSSHSGSAAGIRSG